MRIGVLGGSERQRMLERTMSAKLKTVAFHRRLSLSNLPEILMIREIPRAMAHSMKLYLMPVTSAFGVRGVCTIRKKVTHETKKISLSESNRRYLVLVADQRPPRHI